MGIATSSFWTLLTPEQDSFADWIVPVCLPLRRRFKDEVNTPQINSTWTQSQYNAFAARMDTFQKYPNTAGFFIGNEVIDQSQSSF